MLTEKGEGTPAELTAAPADVSKPLYTHPITDLHLGLLSPWAHFDDDTNTLMATDLTIMLVSLYCNPLRGFNQPGQLQWGMVTVPTRSA